MSRIEEARQAWQAAVERMEELSLQLEGLPDDTEEDVVRELEERFADREREAERCKLNLDRLERIAQARAAFVGNGTGDSDAEQRTDTTDGRTSADIVAAGRGDVRRVQVGREPLTYERANPRTSFFRDLFHAWQGDASAQQRLQRHQREMMVERRDLSSTDGVGGDFVPPLWIMDEWTRPIRLGRPFANAVNNVGPPPAGTDTISLPRLLTGSAVSAQADLGAVQETDATTGQFTVGVKTLAGQQDMARQLIDRSQPGMDQIIAADLREDYDLRLDLQCLSGSGSGANALGVLNDANRIQVTYTQATPAVGGAGGFYAKVADAAQRVQTQRGMPPDIIVMHPRRWGWVMASSDTTNRPLIDITGGGDLNAPGTGGLTGLGATGFTFAGLRVIVDGNLPTTGGAGTNEDTVIVARSADLYLWEDAVPRFRVFEEVLSANLAVRLQLWNYFAFTSARYSVAAATLSGTGLVAPTF
jgi:HK97 family phage major capsid protein